MDDIKSLEKIVERCEDCKFAACENCEINWAEVQSIKKIIKENKELKEGQIETLDKILQPQLLKKYVSKDKIEKRIEWFKDAIKHDVVGISDVYEYIIEELKALLEEGD